MSLWVLNQLHDLNRGYTAEMTLFGAPVDQAAFNQHIDDFCASYPGMRRGMEPYRDLVGRAVDGYISPVWRYDGSSVGRWTSTPNMVSLLSRIPEIRNAFPELGIVCARQMELYLFVKMAGEPELIEAYEAGHNLNDVVAQELGIPRIVARRLNFGVVCGSSEVTVAEAAREPLEYIAGLLQRHRARYPRLEEYTRRMENEGKTRGGATTPILGTRVNLSRSAPRMMAGKLTFATVSDLMKIAFCTLWSKSAALVSTVGPTRVHMITPDELFVFKRVLPEARELVRTVWADEGYQFCMDNPIVRKTAWERLLEDDD